MSAQPAGVIARLWAVIMDRVPLGYEDEWGFHLGSSLFHMEMTKENEFRCPFRVGIEVLLVARPGQRPKLVAPPF